MRVLSARLRRPDVARDVSLDFRRSSRAAVPFDAYLQRNSRALQTSENPTESNAVLKGQPNSYLCRKWDTNRSSRTEEVAESASRHAQLVQARDGPAWGA